MSAVHRMNCLEYGVPEDQPAPNKFRVKIVKKVFKK